MIIIFSLLALVVTGLISWTILLRDSKKYNVPGPTPYPIIGNGYLFISKSSDFLPQLRRLMLEYGNAYRVFLLHEPYIVLSHPKYVEPLLSHSELIVKGKSYSYLLSWLGNGLLTSTGQRWRNTRKFLTPAFHFNILQNFLPVFLKNEKILIKKLRDHADGRAFNVLPIMALTALDNVTESIMGVAVNAQTNRESKYVKSIETLAKITSSRMRNPLLGEDIIFNMLSAKKQQDEAVKYVHSETNKVIKARRQELKLSKITRLEKNNDMGIKNKHAFLDLLLLAEVDGKPINDEHVREEVDTFMFEGHDTTASGLAFSLYCMSLYPNVQEKILEEQKTILGDDLTRDPTYSEVQQMKYLDCVIRESLRIFPSVPLIERMITEDSQVGELRIPKNTSVIINILELQRHPDLYEDPMEFRPERFETMNAKNAFSWIAFSAGPRNCIGQKFAMLELKATLASIVQKFRILPADSAEPILCAELVLRSENGVRIKLMPRKSE
ncbi:cytochrome P450 CYP4L4 [Danaus plexippus plexippus]|uniref:Cytochrome P450 CYP4L4 n=1 Tax=Danaus plexippus plexippus TaxID=278856 RepID=A0A212EY40_DANPL|nr:cytochrome P450 CYP4L4 [Danaus plexippus plexippus]